MPPEYPLYIYNIRLCVPPSSYYQHSCGHISAIYKNIYLLFLHNIIIIIITNMTLHAQYHKLYI